MATAAQTADLLSLARNREPQARERLLEAVLSLCGSATEAAGQPAVQPVLSSVLQQLADGAGHDMRLRLCRRIASASWAPPDTIWTLANDEIEIANLIIAESPVLQDDQLISLVSSGSVDHQIAVARRAGISADVVRAILERDEPVVLGALASNKTADIPDLLLSGLVEKSRLYSILRAPLARHPRLSLNDAERLYGWVGAPLRKLLLQRFSLESERLNDANNDSADGPLLPVGLRESVAQAERADELPLFQEQQLVEKLHQAGQLRPGFLIRALREGRMRLFVLAIARLGDFEVAAIQRAIDSQRPELLGLACAAVGIDRSVFPTILEELRNLNQGRPGGGDDGLRRASGAFGPFSPSVAAMAFRQAITAV
ncbi:MAG: DUF2336 domain-containing protein [Caulobacteraceae bacterium]|nr:DUF2336 domain-containing protein [Caulobacteraceae bacterium]